MPAINFVIGSLLAPCYGQLILERPADFFLKKREGESRTHTRKSQRISEQYEHKNISSSSRLQGQVLPWHWQLASASVWRWLLHEDIRLGNTTVRPSSFCISLIVAISSDDNCFRISRESTRILESGSNREHTRSSTPPSQNTPKSVWKSSTKIMDAMMIYVCLCKV